MQRDLQTLLGDLGALGQTLSAAIESDDVMTAIATMVQLRRTRSMLARAEASEEQAPVLAQRMVGARSAEAVMKAWHTRTLPGDATLLGTPLGIATLADAMLPEVWDYDVDLVVLVGSELGPVGDLMAQLGQRRIVMLGEAPAADSTMVHVRSTDEIVAAVRTMVPIPPTQVIVRGAYGVAVEELGRISDIVRSTLSDLRIHRNTVLAFSSTWLDQALTNLPALATSPSVASVGDRFAGVPMVIIAPGPSLAGNVAQLRALKGRAIITAFSHSLKPVLAAGITPDLILTVDPQDVRYHFAGCDTRESWLVNAATCHPALFELPAKGHLSLSANSALDDWIFAGLSENAVVPGGGSVATTALSLAVRWKCDPVIFVGLDLSFPGGAYYVSTSSDGAARAEVDEHGAMRVSGWSDAFHTMKSRGGPRAAAERAVELPGWHGGTVPSSFMFSMFHRWFVEQLADGRVESTVYNCTEGGAHIPGMRHEKLADVLAGLETTYDVPVTLAEIQHATDQADRASRLGTAYRNYLGRMRRCRKLALRGRSAIASADMAGLAKVERALVQVLRPLEFLSLVAQRAVEGATAVAMRPGSEASYLAASDRLLASLVSVIDRTRPQLETALGRLQYSRHGRAA